MLSCEMSIDDKLKAEPLTRSPQTIREFYDKFVAGIGGGGENPIFSRAPEGAVFKNTVGDEKPLLYVKEVDGSVKQWLTAADLENVGILPDQVRLDEEQLFDMFSFMVGGRKPSLRNLGVNRWSDLLSPENEVNQEEKFASIRKIFEFLDKYNTNMTQVFGNILGLSTNCTQRFKVTNGNREGIVILMGDTCFNRGKMFVWHSIRNIRSPIQSCSPFKSDGNWNIGDINDIQIGYQSVEGPRIVRLNKFVFLMARHGLGEQTTEETALDQIYMTPGEFMSQLYTQDKDAREKQHRIEEDNFVINYKLNGSQELIKQRKNDILAKMLEMASNGDLEDILRNIEQFKP